MAEGEYEPITASRRIGSPAAEIFQILADPGRHRDLDGSGMFELTPDGPDATIVTEIFDCSRVPEDERVDIDNGNIWVESMTRTLERLDELCTSQP